MTPFEIIEYDKLTQAQRKLVGVTKRDDEFRRIVSNSREFFYFHNGIPRARLSVTIQAGSGGIRQLQLLSVKIAIQKSQDAFRAQSRKTYAGQSRTPVQEMWVRALEYGIKNNCNHVIISNNPAKEISALMNWSRKQGIIGNNKKKGTRINLDHLGNPHDLVEMKRRTTHHPPGQRPSRAKKVASKRRRPKGP